MENKPSLDELVHYGVKGMKWGVTNADRPSGVSRGTDREARKDAKEFSRAKLFYGEGAGTRRKLIKATVEAKSKKDPSYKKAFDHHVANQDLSKHASKARGERKRKDVRNSAAKTTRGVTHIVKGNPQYASAAASLLVGGALFAHKKGIDKAVANAAKSAYSKTKDARARQQALKTLRDMGIKF